MTLLEKHKEFGNDMIKLTNVEQSIVYFFLWRIINLEDDWFEGGIKNLAQKLGRHEKSIANSIKSLESKKMIATSKIKNRVCLKLSLSDDELYSRLAFISDTFCAPISIQDLKEDLENENKRLEEEIKKYDKLLSIQKEEDRIIESVAKQISRKDIEELANRIVVTRTYANINKTLDEIIREELENFRAKMFSKYGNIDVNKPPETKLDGSLIYDNFWLKDKEGVS